jgi:hypothetical protein
MENLIQFLNDNINYQLLIIIILGGIFITKYTKNIFLSIGNTYKVLYASILFSTIFYFIEGCGKECYSSYFMTYLFATSFYELFVKWFISKIKLLTENNK